MTHVDASLWGVATEALPPGTSFTVCLLAASMAGQIASATQQVAAMGYDVFGVATTTGPDGSFLIALAGLRIGSADGLGQWVFFFSGTTYLGTDTAAPSPTIALAGSPAPGQIDVRYATYGPTDPACCPSGPPVTITYTWDGVHVTPNGTPPGH